MASLNEWLLMAAEAGKVDEIAALLGQGADIDFVGRYCHTPLMEAIKSENEAAALYIIERGANVRLADDEGDTALHLACDKSLEAVARELLKRRADVEAKGWNKRRSLHKVARWGHENIARLLVTEHGALVDAKDRYAFTPLMLALRHGHEGVAAFLLSAGADASISSISGWTALNVTCRGGLASIVARLLDEFGADLHAKTEGNSCLHLAALDGHVKKCKLLLERGLPVDVLDHQSRNPLLDACWTGQTPVAELLLDHGADIEHKDDRGWTPLSQTIVAGLNREPLALLLIQHGARLDGSLPQGFPFASIDEGLAVALEDDFLETLFTEPDTPIPPYRRALRLALTSPTAAALVEQYGWPLVGIAKTDDEAEEMKKERLSLLEDDAWKRRMHLVIDRALDWGYTKKSEAKKPRLGENKEGEEEGRAANAGAGKA